MHFPDAIESPNCSYAWKSIILALPILKSDRCWRVENDVSIRVNTDKWIPNYPKNKILYLIHEDDEELLVFDLIDPNLHCWKRDFIMTRFSKEEAEAICRIPPSRRDVSDLVVWLHNRNEMYSVKSKHHVARKVMRKDDWVECSRGPGGQ